MRFDVELKKKIYFSAEPYMPNCSSPVLLNTVDPGFRLAYCHNLINLKGILIIIVIRIDENYTWPSSILICTSNFMNLSQGLTNNQLFQQVFTI